MLLASLAISEQARNRAKRTKLYLESRYKHIFSVLEKGDVYNPLQVIRNREDDRGLKKAIEPKSDETVKEDRRKRERLRDQLLHSAQQLPGYNALANLVLQGSIYSDSETESRPQSKSIWDVNPEEAVRDYLYQKVKEQEMIKDLQQQLRASLADPSLENGAASDSPATENAKIPTLRRRDSSADSSVSVPDAPGYKTPPQVSTAPQSSSSPGTTTASSPQFGGLGFFNRSSKSSVSNGKKQKASSNESGGSSRSPSRSRSSSLSSAKKALGLGNSSSTPIMFPDSRSTPNSPRHQSKSFTSPIMPSVPMTRKVTDVEDGKSNGNVASRPLALSTGGLLRSPELTGIAELPTPQQSPSTSRDVSMAGIGDAFTEKNVFEEAIEGFTAGQARGTAETAANTVDVQSQLEEVKTLRMRYDEDILRLEALQDDCRRWLNEQMQEFVRQDVRLEDGNGDVGESSIEGRLRQSSEQDRYRFDDKLQAVQQRTRLWNAKLREADDKTKGYVNRIDGCEVLTSRLERVMDQCTHDMIDLTSEIIMHYGRQAKLVEQDIEILLKEMDVSFLRNTSYITLNWAVSTLLVLIQAGFIVVRFGIAVVSRVVWFIVPFWLVRIGVRVMGWLVIPLLYFLFDVIKMVIKVPILVVFWPMRTVWRMSRGQDSSIRVQNGNGSGPGQMMKSGRGREFRS